MTEDADAMRADVALIPDAPGEDTTGADADLGPDTGVDADMDAGMDAGADATADVSEVGSDAPPGDGVDGDAAPSGPAYHATVFRATHNSYSGGARGPLRQQLDRGVRFVEFDIHDNDYASVGDYQLGHLWVGNDVSREGGNPASNRLGDWLAQVADWSLAHPTHAPLTVALDLKDDLTDNPSFAAGNLAALNAALERAFGARLAGPDEVGAAWPSTEALRGRVLAVLSGHGDTRLAYVRDRGTRPAVAVNARGQVIEVHDSGSGDLWYWTGAFRADGTIAWLRHGRYDTGRTPAVALSDDGWVVEVHQSDTRPRLFYHVGRLGPDFEVAWGPSQDYDSGILPTVAFTGTDGRTVREVHRSEVRDQNWTWTGRLNTATRSIAWDPASHATTSDPRYDTQTATAGALRVTVFTGSDGASPADTLRYTTPAVMAGRIRYVQRAFVEYQPGNTAELRAAARFAAAEARNRDFLVRARADGFAVRAWGFNDAALGTDPPANFPATDHPDAAWYVEYCRRLGAVE